MSGGGLLVLDNVTLSYDPNRPVLTAVSVTPVPGQLIAVTGPSGVGKTTLLWAMAGLLRPAAGTITIDGVPLRDRDHAVEEATVLIPQDNGLAAFLTAQENIHAALLARGVPAGDATKTTDASLARLGLADQGDQLVEELSGGQQQRTAVARGLALRGRILLADEVTSELDAQNRRRVLDLLQEEAYRGAAVVFATHDQEAADACDMEVHLSGGQAHYVRTSRPLPTR